jgi:replicative DNA helicase Mcm
VYKKHGGDHQHTSLIIHNSLHVFVTDDDQTIIEQFEQFFQLNYQDEILQKSGSDEAALVVEFPELSMFDLSLAENLLENPEETIEAANLALETFDTTSNALNARFCNLPSSSHLPIRETRSKHLNKFHQFQGIIKQKNDVKPQLIAATFECPRCQTHQVIKQNEKKLKKPRKCGECGWKGSFNLVEKDLQDVQKMVLEEAPEELTGGEQPKRINCFLTDDLVSPMSEKKTNPGSKVTVVGTLKEVPVNLSTGAKSTSYDLQIEGNYVEPLQEEFSDLEIDSKERQEIIDASKDPRIFEKFVESIAPSIYGHDKIKEALTLQLFGGVRKDRSEGVQQRGDIHILLVGDPGAGKCLRGDAKVQMGSGDTKRLDQVKEDETVLTTGPEDQVKEQTVIATHERTVQKLLKCKTETGKTVELTPEHKLRQPNNTWRPAFTLSEKDSILCYDPEEDETRYEEIIRIEEKQGEITVYDITVPETHNFVANNVIVHNSQMLKRISHVAPKSRFVSGKGSTGAGLCVAPDTEIVLGDGTKTEIQELVESNLDDPEQVRDGVWKQDSDGNVEVQGLDEDWEHHTATPNNLWKLDAPDTVMSIETSDGSSIEVTPETSLLTTDNANFVWKKAKHLSEDEHIATPESITKKQCEQPYLVDFLPGNPVVHDVEWLVRDIKEKIQEQHPSIREAANKLGVSEHGLYHTWVREDARGTIKKDDLEKIAEATNTSWKEHANTFSYYNGKPFTIPVKPTTEFAYVAGLLLGDGDIQETPNSFSIRLSSRTKALRDAYKAFLDDHGYTYDVRHGNDQRPTAVRTTSKGLASLFKAYGVQPSPKEDVTIPNNVLQLDDERLNAFLSGLYDADGSVHRRPNSNGSSTIEFYTTSEQLANDVKHCLLRNSIQAQLRSRPPQETGPIQRNKPLHVLTIYGQDNLKRFAEKTSLNNPEKRSTLELFKKQEKETNPNKNLIPNLSPEYLKQFDQTRTTKKASLRIGKETAENISTPGSDLHEVSQKPVVWKQISNIEPQTPDYDHVYDLTIADSHNFVANDIYAHNTASVVKDEFLKGWALEAGALVLANKGIACIDELDKMDQEDASAMHEALEQQSVTISKANIQATLKAQTTVLAAANPKYGRFDPYDVIAKQIDMPSTLINRFDLIFPIRDIPDKDKDKKLSSFILNLHKDGEDKEAPYETKFIKRYIAFARQRVAPTLTDEALEEIQDYFVSMRSQAGEGERIQSIPISARQLEGLVRLATGSAKTRLSQTVEKQDAERAVELLHYSLTKIGYDEETGKFDIDKIETGTKASERSKISIIKELITSLEEESGESIPLEDLYQEAEAREIDEHDAEEIVEKLKRKGDIYEPTSGYISRIQ